MSLKKKLLSDKATGTLLNYTTWCLDHKIHERFGVEVTANDSVSEKHLKTLYESVDPTNHEAYGPELDDLTRLHFLARSRKVTTILEFGVGKSTTVLADALKRNKEDYEEFVSANLRRENSFEIYSVDNSAFWIETCKANIPADLASFVNFHQSEVEMTTFNDRACTMYRQLPNICPDMIYLDGPAQYNVHGSVRGIHTGNKDRVPMAADLLMMEPFLLPGTLIVVDGRTANARFLKNNFQMNWEYEHWVEEDVHVFELVEEPLGRFNACHLEYIYS